MRLGILGSTRGTNLEAITAAISQKILNASIQVVISNKEQAGILERARQHHLPAFFVSSSGLSRDEHDALISALLKSHQVDFIVLIGYMRILSARFVNEWHEKIINIHPSLLPLHKGLMDLDVHQAVLDSNAQETGCSVHYVSEKVDEGEVVLQKSCPVFQTDTPAILKARVQQLEGEALVEALSMKSKK